MVNLGSMRFAEVAVDVPMASSRTFSYEIPDELTVRPGQLVRVPFGARTLQGIVFSLSAHPQVPETKPIADLVFEEPLLDDVHLKLAAWISEYLHLLPVRGVRTYVAARWP